MRKLFSILFSVVLFGNLALAATSTTDGELSGERSAETEEQANNYSCWAQTTCDNGQVLHCSVTASHSCRWEAGDARYVLCEGYNLDGTGNRFYFTCPN